MYQLFSHRQRVYFWRFALEKTFPTARSLLRCILMQANTEFTQLVSDAMAGSNEAIQHLAQQYTPHIIRAVRSTLSQRLRSKLDSQDFAQSLWASLFIRHTDLARLTSPIQFISFLRQSARHKVIDKTRHYCTQKNNLAREERLTDHTSRRNQTASKARQCALRAREPSPSTVAGLKDAWARILLNCSDRDRQILELRLQGYTFDDISDKLQINQATARRAIKTLVSELRRHA